MSDSCVTETRSFLLRLFRDAKGVFCYVCYPGASYNIVTDSPCKQKYEVESFRCLGSSRQLKIHKAVQYIVDEGIRKIFSGSIHNSHFWWSYFHSLSLELGGRLLHFNRGGVKEEDVSSYLIKPLLERAANATSTIPIMEDAKSLEYCSSVGIQAKSQISTGIRGIPPKVDFAMMGFAGKDAVYIIPVEVKTTMVKKDMAQIAQYMSTMGNGKHIKDLSMVGMLIDQENIRFAFSVFSLSDSGATIPLPLVLISKQIRWRREISLIRHICIAISLLTNFRLKRLPLDSSNGQEYFAMNDWSIIKEIAKNYSKFSVCRPPYFVPRDIYRELDDIKKNLSKIIAEKDQEIADLKDALKKFQHSEEEEEEEEEEETDDGEDKSSNDD